MSNGRVPGTVSTIIVTNLIVAIQKDEVGQFLNALGGAAIVSGLDDGLDVQASYFPRNFTFVWKSKTTKHNILSQDCLRWSRKAEGPLDKTFCKRSLRDPTQTSVLYAFRPKPLSAFFHSAAIVAPFIILLNAWNRRKSSLMSRVKQYREDVEYVTYLHTTTCRMKTKLWWETYYRIRISFNPRPGLRKHLVILHHSDVGCSWTNFIPQQVLLVICVT